MKNHLPKYAAEIFLATVNNALKEYNEEEKAFKVAWAADDGNWQKKPD